MSPQQLEAGYRRIYRDLYSWQNVVARRPPGVVRASAYLAMTALYKKWDFLWKAMIPMRLTHSLWSPLVELHWRMGRSARLRWTAPLEQPADSPRKAERTRLALVA